MDGWPDGWMDRWMDGRTDGMNGWGWSDWVLPAGTADTGSIASLMRIGTTSREHAPNLTADVTIAGVVHGHGILQYAFLSVVMVKLQTISES